MKQTKVRYALKARYGMSHVHDEKLFDVAVDSLAEALAGVFKECMICLNYELVALGLDTNSVNVEVIVEADETYHVPTFPPYFSCSEQLGVFALDEDSCETEVL